MKSEEAAEKHFQYTFYLILRVLGENNCRLLNEQTQAKGRVDCILEFKNHVYIFEFKLDGSAEQALAQIDDRGYLIPYTVDGRKLMKIGVNVDPKERNIGDWKIN